MQRTVTLGDGSTFTMQDGWGSGGTYTPPHVSEGDMRTKNTAVAHEAARQERHTGRVSPETRQRVRKVSQEVQAFNRERYRDASTGIVPAAALRNHSRT